MTRSIDDLKVAVKAIVEKSTLKGRLLGIEIEPNDDPDQPFLRVNLQIHGIGKLSVEELIDLQMSIEDGLSTIDERFASVRFAEAA